MKNPFKNQQGQVRWGYKFFSLILIWDMVIPVIILGIALAFTLAFRILLMNMGIMDGDGVLMESYRGQADNWYMVILMCIQNLVIIFLPFALWKWGFHSSWKNLGIHGKTWLRDMGKGLLLGAVMITLVAAGICLTGNASMGFGKDGFDPWLIGYLVMFISVGFGEEIFFRGYAMDAMRQARPGWLALILPALLFGIAHSTNSNFSLLGFINICFVGIFLGLLFWYTAQLWIPIVFPIAWNYFQGPVYGLEVSGINTPHMFTTAIGKANLLNGGLFGPEGGLFTTLVTLLAIGGVLWYYRGKKGRFMPPQQ